MPRVMIGSALPDRLALDAEIAQLRGLDLAALRGRWLAVFGRLTPAQLPKHLVFRMLAYRLQADRFGDLDQESQRLLDGAAPEKVATQRKRQVASLRPGTMLGREWNGQMHRVAVLAEGFAWNGNTYRSLTSVAVAIAGTRWNGPRFFGLRDKTAKETRP